MTIEGKNNVYELMETMNEGRERKKLSEMKEKGVGYGREGQEEKDEVTAETGHRVGLPSWATQSWTLASLSLFLSFLVSFV